MHEQDDVLTVFSPDVHSHVTPRRAFLHIAVFLLALLGVVGATRLTFTPLQAVRRTYPYDGESRVPFPSTLVRYRSKLSALSRCCSPGLSLTKRE